MQKPFKTAERAFIAILALLAALLVLRGGHAMITGEYEGIAKYGGPYDLHGREAVLHGAALLFLGGMLAAAVAALMKANEKKCVAFGIGCLAASVCCFIASLFR